MGAAAGRLAPRQQSLWLIPPASIRSGAPQPDFTTKRFDIDFGTAVAERVGDAPAASHFGRIRPLGRQRRYKLAAIGADGKRGVGRRWHREGDVAVVSRERVVALIGY